MPVDLYVGGAEHAVLHLLYSRFWHKVLFDRGHVATPEPFQRLVNQGMILGEMEYHRLPASDDGQCGRAGRRRRRRRGDDGEPTDRQPHGRPVEAASRSTEEQVEKKGDGFVLKADPTIRVDAAAYKMSKSRGNVVNPDDVVEEYGADSLRLYEMFMGPLEATKPWSMRGVEGVYRFLNRVWRLIIDDRAEDDEAERRRCRTSRRTRETLRMLHQHDPEGDRGHWTACASTPPSPR